MGTITAANSIYMLTIPSVFPIPQQLQGYATDDAFNTEAIETAEVVMGVDGIQSSGYMPNSTPQTIHLQADSTSIALFEAWLAAEKALKEKLAATATIILSSVSRKYVCTRGILSTVKQMPDAKKVLQPRDFKIVWQDISPVPFG